MPPLTLPKIGFGTWQLSPKICTNATLKALEIGYRFIDTAQIYGIEDKVGDAIAENIVDRKEIILATKVWVTNLAPDKVISSTEESLRKLKTDYIDILYIHWPARFAYRKKKTLSAFVQLVEQGKIKYIGVSNFSPALIDKARDFCSKPIIANQIECHPLLQQHSYRKHLKKNDMYLIAYSPLARGQALNLPEIQQVAEKHKISRSQAILAWLISMGDIPIPKASSEAHIRENFEAQSIHLDPEDIERIISIKKEKRLINPPILRPKW